MDQNISTVQDKQPKKLGLFRRMKARVFVMAMAIMTVLSISAFATDGETPATGFEAVVSSMDTLGTLMGKVWTLMTGNALLTLFLAVSLLSVGVSVFGMIKRAAHR